MKMKLSIERLHRNVAQSYWVLLSWYIACLQFHKSVLTQTFMEKSRGARILQNENELQPNFSLEIFELHSNLSRFSLVRLRLYELRSSLHPDSAQIFIQKVSPSLLVLRPFRCQMPRTKCQGILCAPLNSIAALSLAPWLCTLLRWFPFTES